MARRKRVEPDLAAWAKAHEAEAKRAERAAKIGGDIGEAWLTYAGKCRREAFDVLTRDPLPLECDLSPARSGGGYCQAATPGGITSWHWRRQTRPGSQGRDNDGRGGVGDIGRGYLSHVPYMGGDDPCGLA
jgi:hypothetical protein